MNHVLNMVYDVFIKSDSQTSKDISRGAKPILTNVNIEYLNKTLHGEKRQRCSTWRRYLLRHYKSHKQNKQSDLTFYLIVLHCSCFILPCCWRKSEGLLQVDGLDHRREPHIPLCRGRIYEEVQQYRSKC